MVNQLVGLTLSRTVPQSEHVVFPSGEVPGVNVACLVGLAGGYELFFRELADCLEHCEPCSLGVAMGDDEGLAGQRMEYVERGELVGVHDRAGARQIESTCEHRASSQQRLLSALRRS